MESSHAWFQECALARPGRTLLMMDNSTFTISCKLWAQTTDMNPLLSDHLFAKGTNIHTLLVSSKFDQDYSNKREVEKGGGKEACTALVQGFECEFYEPLRQDRKNVKRFFTSLVRLLQAEASWAGPQKWDAEVLKMGMQKSLKWVVM
ncbi:hypothetical protein CPB84DRAFT_1749540 [Gymnopilus junonius]|uniref:Uncharacterized protein n=1 Tax=Gymnopilus junonius TaxID=109634 RepID=A0A9P5TJI5_GYMJU|nr:hypothetical protein CPB84DRAFT_1749540 [Gymnopilus junonius]